MIGGFIAGYILMSFILVALGAGAVVGVAYIGYSLVKIAVSGVVGIAFLILVGIAAYAIVKSWLDVFLSLIKKIKNED